MVTQKKICLNVTYMIFKIFCENLPATNFKAISMLLHQKSLLWQQNVRRDVSHYQMHSLHLLVPISLELVPPLPLWTLPSKLCDLWPGCETDQSVYSCDVKWHIQYKYHRNPFGFSVTNMFSSLHCHLFYVTNKKNEASTMGKYPKCRILNESRSYQMSRWEKCISCRDYRPKREKRG